MTLPGYNNIGKDSASKNKLAQCPCGEIPSVLLISELYTVFGPGGMLVGCDRCRVWRVPFTVNSLASAEEILEAANKAWNNAPFRKSVTYVKPDIERYTPFVVMNDRYFTVEFKEANDGRWVKWETVEKLLSGELYKKAGESK